MGNLVVGRESSGKNSTFMGGKNNVNKQARRSEMLRSQTEGDWGKLVRYVKGNSRVMGHIYIVKQWHEQGGVNSYPGIGMKVSSNEGMRTKRTG